MSKHPKYFQINNSDKNETYWAAAVHGSFLISGSKELNEECVGDKKFILSFGDHNSYDVIVEKVDQNLRLVLWRVESEEDIESDDIWNFEFSIDAHASALYTQIHVGSGDNIPLTLSDIIYCHSDNGILTANYSSSGWPITKNAHIGCVVSLEQDSRHIAILHDVYGDPGDSKVKLITCEAIKRFLDENIDGFNESIKNISGSLTEQEVVNSKSSQEKAVPETITDDSSETKREILEQLMPQTLGKIDKTLKDYNSVKQWLTECLKKVTENEITETEDLVEIFLSQDLIEVIVVAIIESNRSLQSQNEVVRDLMEKLVISAINMDWYKVHKHENDDTIECPDVSSDFEDVNFQFMVLALNDSKTKNEDINTAILDSNFMGPSVNHNDLLLDIKHKILTKRQDFEPTFNIPKREDAPAVNNSFSGFIKSILYEKKHAVDKAKVFVMVFSELRADEKNNYLEVIIDDYELFKEKNGDEGSDWSQFIFFQKRINYGDVLPFANALELKLRWQRFKDAYQINET
ncbi:MAG: hypothetical protein AAF984_08350 [Verrucomicrobiota bacterium]